MAAHGLQMNGATATPLLRRAIVVALCRSPGRMGKARNSARTARRTVPTKDPFPFAPLKHWAGFASLSLCVGGCSASRRTGQLG